MRLWLRIALYLGGGGLLLSWIDPPAGLAQFALVGAIIVVSSYVDRWLFRPTGAGSGSARNVVSLHALRRSRQRRTGVDGAVRERRVLHTVFSSGAQNDVDEVLALLRGEGLNPVMISQSAVREGAGARYEVRLSDQELERGRPLVQFFLLKSTKKPS